MDYAVAETLQILIGMIGVTTVAVTALKVWVRRKELDYRGDHHLEDTVESLRVEMEDLRADHTRQMTDLQERVDFAERLLAKGPGGH